MYRRVHIITTPFGCGYKLLFDGAAFCFQCRTTQMGCAYNWKQTVFQIYAQCVQLLLILIKAPGKNKPSDQKLTLVDVVETRGQIEILKVYSIFRECRVSQTSRSVLQSLWIPTRRAK